MHGVYNFKVKANLMSNYLYMSNALKHIVCLCNA